jgi:hypothetical protein
MANTAMILMLYTLNMYRKYSVWLWYDIFWTDYNNSTSYNINNFFELWFIPIFLDVSYFGIQQ